jgi:hypothetical protein
VSFIKALHDDLFNFPFFVSISAVVDDQFWKRIFSSFIHIRLVRLKICNRDNRVDLPYIGDLKFIGKMTDFSEDLEWANTL